jgi:membrane protease YdiL (CAAX protease family)
MKSVCIKFTGFLLALPFITLILLFILGIEPYLGPLDPYLDPANSHLGSFIVFSALLLSLAGFAICAIPVVQKMQAGNGIASNPINLLLASIILFFILAFIGLIFVDQYPCWIGVPNCD